MSVKPILSLRRGVRGPVTIATNMAGRGTDIVLGGNPEMMAQAESATSENPEERYQELLEKYIAQCRQEKQEVLDAGGPLYPRYRAS